MPVDSAAWITLNDAKYQTHIGLSETDFDTQLTDLINRSYKILEAYIGHPIKSHSVTEYHDGDGTTKLMLRDFPVISITSISIDTDLDRDFTDSDEQVLSTNYYVDNDNGIIEFVDDEGSGPIVFETGVKNIKIVYTAGYATIPADLVHAGCMHVSWLFQRSATEGLTTASMGGKAEVYDNQFLPPYIRRMLDKYKILQV